MPSRESRSIRATKSQAKQLRKQLNISHTDALNLISKQNGFNNWRSYLAHLEAIEQSSYPLPVPTFSASFTQDKDIAFSEDDFEALDSDENRVLPSDIENRILNNIRTLTKAGVEFSVFQPTSTGLSKSILDATHPVRTYMTRENFHNYEIQEQGPNYKIRKTAFFADDYELKETKASFYRPKTKNGDPRMWFRGLGKFAVAGDQVAIIIIGNASYLVNLSKIDLEKSLRNTTSVLSTLVARYKHEDQIILFELLDKLKVLAKKPFPSLRTGDTGVGFTLETLLGIQANSSKTPDYNGIELKSGRSQKNRTTLFAQVPNWALSNCKKSAEILDRYGYERGEDLKLYCTVSTIRENSQGLYFNYDQSSDQLVENHSSGESVAIWTGKQLRERLLEKHNETLWIQANSLEINGIEHFQLVSAIYTKAPILSQLMPLINSGIVTMDHLIKRNGKTGRVSEKGPLFKIKKSNLDLLFPTPTNYDLL